MNSWAGWASAVGALIAAAVAGAAWYQASGQVRQLRLGELAPIAALLSDDRQLLATLQSDLAGERDAAILGSYLAKIRADGLPKHADVKQRLDRLAENNGAIVTLIQVYSPHAKTAAFGNAAAKFQRYAIAWRDRWSSVMELFMAGGHYPAAGVPFPTEFAGAVQAEIDAVGQP